MGLTERNGGFKSTILIPVEKRDYQTLIPIIEMFVRKDSKIVITDMWKGYSSLKDKGFDHKMINHSKNFVAPLRE